jgi:hypothetical protein
MLDVLPSLEPFQHTDAAGPGAQARRAAVAAHWPLYLPEAAAHALAQGPGPSLLSLPGNASTLEAIPASGTWLASSADAAALDQQQLSVPVGNQGDAGMVLLLTHALNGLGILLLCWALLQRSAELSAPPAPGQVGSRIKAPPSA